MYLHGGNARELEKVYGKDIIDFSSNINFAFPRERILKTVISNLELIFSYPEVSSSTLRSKAAEHLSVKKENILFGNGASELIHLVLKYLAPEKVSIPVPTFVEYERAARNAGIEVEHIPLEKWSFKLPSFNKAGFLILCNPNNPTGNLLAGSIDDILKQGSFSFLVIDESFMDFVDCESSIARAVQEDNVIVIRSMTKFFSIPGLRLGYLAGNETIIKKLEGYIPSWNVNSIAQAVGEYLFEFKNSDEIKAKIEKEKEFLYNGLQKIKNFNVYPSVTNFFLIELKGNITGKILQEKLLKNGILIKDCSNIPDLGDKYIRIACLDRDKNTILLSCLKELLR